jgi:hypothetical protein
MNYWNSGGATARGHAVEDEDGNITVFRAFGSIDYIAVVKLAAAINP